MARLFCLLAMLVATSAGAALVEVPCPPTDEILLNKTCNNSKKLVPKDCFRTYWLDNEVRTFQRLGVIDGSLQPDLIRLLPENRSESPDAVVLFSATDLVQYLDSESDPLHPDLFDYTIENNLDWKPGPLGYPWTLRFDLPSAPMSPMAPRVPALEVLSELQERSTLRWMQNWNVNFQVLAVRRAPYAPPTNPDYDSVVNLDRIRARPTRNNSRATASVGQRIRVAVVDSGIRRDHDDLAGVTIDGLSCTRSGCYQNHGNDVRGHGTRLAGTIASQRHGVAHNAAVLIPIQVIEANGCVWSRNLIAGSRFAATHADIVVMALDIPYSESLETVLEPLVHLIRENDQKLFIAAAGNTGHTPIPAIWEERVDNLLVVGGVRRTFNQQIGEWFEAWHKNAGLHIDLAAPSTDCLVSDWRGDSDAWDYDAGTTFATGYVAGVAAKVLAGEKHLSAKDLRARLVDSADCRGAFDHCPNYQGNACCNHCGVVDLVCALNPGTEECQRQGRCSTLDRIEIAKQPSITAPNQAVTISNPNTPD